MKSLLLASVGVGTLLLSTVASAATTSWTAKLEGSQEVPPVTTSAGGSVSFTFDDASKVLSGTITITGLSDTNVTLVHIHSGAAGQNGPVEATLGQPSSGTIQVNQTLTAAQEAALDKGELYVNIHTAANQNGELRGQLQKADSGAPLASDDGGCNSSGGSPSNGIVLGLGIAAALVAARRRR